ncbi:MAG: transglycosylase domain-containing protein [Bacteroidales bacterium]
MISKKKQKKKQPAFTAWPRLRAIAFRSGLWLAVFFAIVLGGLYLAVHLRFFGELPSASELKQIENHNSSEVYASNGELLGKFYIFDRTSISLDEVPDAILTALIVTEDVRFYQHRGTDLRAMGRVLVKNILLGDRSSGGGSTITRQLAKNLYPRTKQGMIWLVGEKIREGTIARRLEKAYSKKDILLLYINTVHFGENVFGLSAAAQRFFDKTPPELSLEEGAVLVGMLKAGTSYNPRLNPERSLQRRNTVISQMERYGHITTPLSDSLKALPLTINYSPHTHLHGPAPHFRERLRLELAEWIDTYNASHGTDLNLYTDGLRIFTTIDARLQDLAEQAVRSHLQTLQKEADFHYRHASPDRVNHLLSRLTEQSGPGPDPKQTEDSIFQSQKLLHAGLVSVEPQTGYVRAWVGGNDIRSFQFDNVSSRRQAGSAFKPFVYAAALEAGIPPCDYVSAEALVLEEFQHWSPANADNNYMGYYSMAGAMAHSVNTVSTRYLLQVGYEPVIGLATRAGLTGPFKAYPSLALGVADVSLLELTTAYAIFANKGFSMSPVWLLRIEDAEGNLLFSESPGGLSGLCISENTASLMTAILGEVTRYGTAGHVGARLGRLMDTAGKTGTTQNNSDSWFIGYSPGLITGVWTGLENPAFARVYPLPFGSSRTAVPIWTEFMVRANQLPATRHFASGRFEPMPARLAGMLDCPPYVEELPRESWFERIFGTGKDRQEREGEPEQPQKRRSLLQRIFDELF